MLPLYQPEKYKVHLGEGNFGFCTVWNEPELVFKKSEIIRQKVAILGTLYSRQGVNVILRNLALNPQIRKLLLWGNGSLSNTKFGVLGSSILEKVWHDGLESDGTVKGTQFKIEKEIKPQVVEEIRGGVELVNISDKSLEQVEDYVKEIQIEKPAYMESVQFPEAIPEAVEVFPSEEVGWLVRGNKILDTWSRVLERIMRYGTIKGTQYGYQQRELIGVTWVFDKEDPTHPDFSLASDWPDNLRQVTGATEEAIKEYHAVFLSAEPPAGVAYTYGNRLMEYPCQFINQMKIIIIGQLRLPLDISYTYGNRLMAYPNQEQVIDQIREVIVKQLLESPDSRRAVATTMVPSIDRDSKEPPCITQIQALQSGGKLHLLTTVRSHDIFKAAIPNAFGLRILQKTITEELGFEIGQLQITSQSAHIYEQDWEDASRLVRCLFWERTPSFTFDPSNQADPRGNVIITIENDKIYLEFQSAEGDRLMKLDAESAMEMSRKVSQLELLSRPDHLMDVGMELQKAEIALRRGIPYRQDKPLIF